MNNQQPSDIPHFLGVKKSEKKIIQSTSYVIILISTIQCWNRYLRLFWVISGYLGLSLAILDNFYQISRVTVKVDARKSKLLLFENCLLFFHKEKNLIIFFSHIFFVI